jgi:hypothetical protein
MRGAPCLHRPAGQQQAEDYTKNQLLLFRQAFHAVNVTGFLHRRNRGVAAFGRKLEIEKCGVLPRRRYDETLIYDLRFAIYSANSECLMIRKS